MSPTNIAASVKALLQNKAKETDRGYAEVLQLFAMERLLYRLSQSDYADTFVLKGALLFAVWEPEYQRRTTVDIDLLGFTDNTLGNIEQIIRAICETAVEEDGLQFNTATMRVERIKEDADYEGVRIRTFALLEKSRIPIQIDVGFGDALVPGSISAVVPTLLDFPAPHLNCYHPLTVIAEKFQAMVQLGELNSRMKDFYDIWNIIQHEEIDGAELQQACVATFEKRETPFRLDDFFFTEGFAHSLGKQTQWTAFIHKQKLEEVAPLLFKEVVAKLHTFFMPMIKSISLNEDFESYRPMGGTWTTK